MLKNYFKIAIRYLFKNKIFSFVNVLGLTIGFACFILLSLFVMDELSFDTFHKDSDRMYRVVQQISNKDGKQRKVATTAPAIGPALAKDFPEVETQTQLISIGRLTVGNEPIKRDYETIWIADANFFKFFDFDFLYGDPKTALTQPDNLVITASMAKKYFGKTDVVGKTLYTNVYQATISGVIKDFPPNSHIRMNTIHTEPTWARQIDGWKKWAATNWTANAMITYVKMEPGFHNKKAFQQKLTSLVAKHYGDDVDYSSSFILQPLTDIHLHSQDIEGGMNAHAGNALYVYMFSIVGILILVIACFNYMNLSTAAGSRRTREVGMRKTLGAGKWQLILQFTGEALLLSLLALLLACTLLEVLLPYVNNFIGKQLSIPYNNLPLIATLFGIVLIAGIASAIYPSFILSRVNPATALKKGITIGSSNFSLRKVLVVAQFVVSIAMIAATIIIYRQLNYVRQKDLGFNVDNLVTVDINSGALRHQFKSIKQEFEKLSEVKSVTVSSRVPGEWKTFPIANVEDRSSDTKGQMIFVGIDKDFLNTYHINLLKGRNLRNTVSDSDKVLLTESAVKELGLKNPIGQKVDINGTLWAGDLDKDSHFSPMVVGVVSDFYFQSFKKKERPLMLASYRNPIQNIDYYTLRINTANWQKTLDKLQAINYKFDPKNPVEYHFLDQHFQEYYQSDQKRGELFLLFSGLIIFIACMGLFALASFAIENRIKEIGVRKVLGASIANITWLLSSEFTELVGIAFVLSIPIAYWAAQSWLQEFAYRISISWWIFPAAGLTALLIALGTVSFQTVRAALVNPVESLRSE
ncbi:MAG TPA: ABC transporter permease [Balneolaceae bacterium]|nr:ABC transporter permease [Balneolaceae bacterium]